MTRVNKWRVLPDETNKVRIGNPWPQAKARDVVARALKTGKLRPGPCLICGSALTCGHHTDYNRPLHVYWLCRSCHARFHARVRQIKREAVWGDYTDWT